MNVSILYFEGCPNHQPTAALVRRVIAESGLDADVEEIEITDPSEAHRRRFLGSPTVLVNGQDIEPAARGRTDFGITCRLYDTPDGLPSRDMLRAALGVGEPAAPSDAAGGASPSDPRDRVGLLAAGGSVITAMLSSACCWIPLVMIAFGVSAAGFSAFFARWRPVFATGALLLLAIGFYLTFLRRRGEGGSCCPPGVRRRRRAERISWYASAVVVGVFVFFPGVAGLLAGDRSASPTVSPHAQPAYIFDIAGMHCETCAVALKSALIRLPGVQAADVSFSTKTARVAAAGPSIVPAVIAAAKKAGFTATLRTSAP